MISTEHSVYTAPALTGTALRDWAQEWENQWGYDSFDTIETHYDDKDDGVFHCKWPECSFARRNVEDMWLHIHFAPKHVKKRKEIDAAHERITVKGWPT